MPWHLVVIAKHSAVDELNPRTLAERFIEDLANEIMKLRAGDDRDIRVYHQSDADSDRFYLSPAAASSAPKLLFGSTECAQEPELAGFEKVEFPFKLG